MLHNKIVNPKTGRQVNVRGLLGQKIIKNHIIQSQSGGVVNKKLFKKPFFNNVIKEINDTFLDYPVRNFDFHTGDDVSDHSIWSALAVKNWFKNNSPWTKHIEDKYKDLAILCAYLHDIGKVGDGDFESLINPGWKETHPEDGFEIMLGKKKFITHDIDISETQKGWFEDKKKKWDGKWYSGTKRSKYFRDSVGINVKEKLLKLGFTEEEVAIITLSVGMHYSFGNEVILAIGTKDRPGKLFDNHEKAYSNYITKFKKLLNKTLKTMNNKNININQAFAICILVSAADVRGANVVKGKLWKLTSPVSKYPKKPCTDLKNKKNIFELFNYNRNVIHMNKLLEKFTIN